MALTVASNKSVLTSSIVTPKPFTCLSIKCRRPLRPSALRVSASSIKPPAGISMPPKEPSVPPAMFGFVDWAEKMNSRAAMIGFFALLAVEGITGKGLLELLGWSIGNGLDIGF
ncbi:hypothetical protein CEUSTIGMA_g13062.t1 [Chlamydomonas eustigma]|uniref:High light inducible protein n=1 Tax=Chlamydomonas eustigma TaxID=1157962 RepID=A0A250XRE6_9CHLO|nr:hypothetical protein CEUSTIGMA_g13062.t1 [Chlamydomonas eustigma]|eukprot:GAX85647.1 hypothetical protein CEUSTIGMA_g13062.t1 [Chlamydomonas eustigma]